MFSHNISKNLHDLRLKKNLTQSQLANELGISRQALHNYEKGLRDPDIITIAKISKFFNCSIDFLVFDNTDTDLSLLHKCLDSHLIDDFDESILMFLENKKIELESIKDSIPEKISLIDTLILSFKKN